MVYVSCGRDGKLETRNTPTDDFGLALGKQDKGSLPQIVHLLRAGILDLTSCGRVADALCANHEGVRKLQPSRIGSLLGNLQRCAETFAKRPERKAGEETVILSFDGMAISQGIVYDMPTGRMMGFSDTDPAAERASRGNLLSNDDLNDLKLAGDTGASICFYSPEVPHM